jgi:hypothetical protein
MKRIALILVALNASVAGLTLSTMGATAVQAETLQSPVDPVIVSARTFGAIRFSSGGRSTIVTLSDEAAGCLDEDPSGPIEALIRVVDEVSDATSHHVVFQYNVPGSCDPAGTCTGTESSSLVSVSFSKRTMRSRNMQIQPIQDCVGGLTVDNLKSSEFSAPIVSLSGGRIRVVSERSDFTHDQAIVTTITTTYARKSASAGLVVKLKQRVL